jgi:hypothetical protein
MLYDDPEAYDTEDAELVKAVTEKLQTDPDYPIPEGYLKIKERTAVHKYVLPAACEEILGNGAFVSAHILDELVNELFGIHFIEPTVTYGEKLKIKKAIQKVEKPVVKAPALSYMRPLAGKIKPMKSPSDLRSKYSSTNTANAKVDPNLAVEENKEPLALGKLRGGSRASSRQLEKPVKTAEELAIIAAEKKEKARIVKESLERMEEANARKRKEAVDAKNREETAKKEK